MSAGDWYLVVYTLGVGVSLPAFWIVAAASGRLRHLGEGRDDFGWHVLAELVAGALLAAAGAGILSDSSWATPMTGVALGAMVYSLVESAGHYLVRGLRLQAGLVLGAWLPLIPAIAILILR